MIRPATLADLDGIMRIERASFPTDAWSEAMMREEIASPHGHYVVLDLAGRLAGYAGVRAPAGARDADVQTLAVAASDRGRGAGRMLLRALLEAAADRGAREVFLEVRADNPVAQRLYVSEGFTAVGRRPRYYQPDDVDAVVMRLDLAAWRAMRAGAPDGSRRQTPADAEGAGSSGVGGDPPALRAATADTAGKGWC